MSKPVRLAGDGPIDIVRDRHGVPHVRATTEPDLFRGLGFCHGRDRALALLLMRILGQGRASEILESSDDMLRADRFFRRLDLGGDLAEEVGKLRGDELERAAAYVDGLNRALARRTPWELRLFGYRPEPWSIADSILLSRVAGYVALAQSQGEMERLFVELVQAGVDTALLAELFPARPSEAELSLLRAVKLGERVVPDVVAWNRIVPRAVASNNWAIAPARSASGHAILANDPHLEANRLPAVWYEIVLELGDRFCIAATMPGLPGPLLGRTNDLAWGATYTFLDGIDSWIEDCRGGCCRRVADGRESWVPFRVRSEVIKRKGKPDQALTVFANEHGVLDGDPRVPGLYLATRWASASGTGAGSLAAPCAMLRAADVEAGRAVLGRIETSWNWVLADRDGNIGYQMSGLMPLRRPGWCGFLPQPGWDPANDWQGFAAPEDLPRALNPECGFLVTANDDLNHLGRLHPINLPMGSYRAERIAARLAGYERWTAADVERLQMEDYSLQAERFMAVLRPLLPPGPAGECLRDWDCRYDVASRGAALFEDVYRELLLEVFGARIGAAAMRRLLDETGIIADFYACFDRALFDPASAWFAGEPRDAILRRAAERALERAGGKPALPRWGERRRLRMKHLLLGGRLPLWLGFDHGPVELAGGRATIHQGQIYRSGERDTSFAPSYRLVTDLGEPGARTCLAGGPSDRRFSRWYTSGIEDWQAGRFKTVGPARQAATPRQSRLPGPDSNQRPIG